MFMGKRIFCRLFQTGFRAAIPFLPYRKPEILQGFLSLPALLKEKKISALLIVTDKGIEKAGLLKPLCELLDWEEISYWIYDRTTPNPTVDNVEEARELYLTQTARGSSPWEEAPPLTAQRPAEPGS